MTRSLSSLPFVLVERILATALEEDLGRAGDITTDALIPRNSRANGLLVARSEGRICGGEVAAAAFRAMDPEVEVEVLVPDGEDASRGETVLRVTGQTRAMLTAERTALNFLGHLSGVATTTRNLGRLIEDYKAEVVCTRKTTPGLRALEKYAVRAGGGRNHRFGLDDAILIKDNHIAAVGSVEQAVRRARAGAGHCVKIEVEVDTLEQLDEVLKAEVDIVLLDNMTPVQLRKAVQQAAGRVETEASGGITADTIEAVAGSGVDWISVGWITHSAPSLDVGLDMSPLA